VTIDSDGMRRFLFEGSNVRGVRVHLSAAWQTLLARHPYPDPVKSILGQSLAAVALLGATIKFDGSLTLQMSGDGPVPMLVVQTTGARTVRGMASVRGDISSDELSDLLGKGHLAITIDQGPGKERYQGIVALQGDRLALVIDAYFENSEQLPTRLWLAADTQHAAGVLLQALPADEFDDDAWQHWITLAETLTSEELLSLSTEQVLRRLFHAEPVRVFAAEPVQFHCRCSRERVSGMLRAMELAELQETTDEEGGILSVSCDFCNADYKFDRIDLEALFATELEQPPPSATTH
jgi:molecular chaperone Hsp33